MKRRAHLLQPTRYFSGWHIAVAALGLALVCLASPQQAVAADQATQNAGPVADVTICAKPVWPQDALAAKQTGTVTMALLIGSDGKVKQSKISKSSGYKELDIAARDGVSKCTFRPGTMEGKPAEAWMMFQYVWSLD